MDKNNKLVALVTGATGGIGSAICKKLADQGYTVVANYRNLAKAQEWQNAMKAAGYNFAIFEGDVTSYESVGGMVAKIEAEVGSVDILVNNAGITKDGRFLKMSPEQWREVMSTNLDSVFNCTRHVIGKMVERGFGRIINISSVNGQRGQFGQTNYSAAKAGMHGFTKSLAMEVADKGVTVNTLSPGYIGTDMVMAVKEEIRNQIIAGIPVKRLGTPDEIASAVVYLSSDAAGFMTGANLSINGGQHVY
ncbi:MAG: acetoacetyl-CoA reductase [Cytophagales bacterium]|nr:MAG: acetoacetyl-CoA reductase [Cytophagales bacterium]TAF60156.1 MAG: acetoacetyl-CoA reductase [Cytophagales bacterium]